MKIKSIYISPFEKASGSLVVTMGMMEFLQKRVGRIGFFRPIIKSRDSIDSDIEFMLERYKIDMSYEDTFGFGIDEVETMIAHNRSEEFIEELIGKYKTVEKDFDFILIEGVHQVSFSSSLDYDINFLIAKNLGTPVCPVLKGAIKSKQEILDEIYIVSKSAKKEGCSHFATFVNRVDESMIGSLQKEKFKNLTYFLPEVKELDTPTIGDVYRGLDCKLIVGNEKDFKRVISSIKVAAMKLENFLERIKGGELIITPADRADIIIGSITSIKSRNYPNITGLLLTGGFEVGENVKRLIEGLSDMPLPILSVKEDTFDAATKVNCVPAQIRVTSERKIALAQGIFTKYVDFEALERKLDLVSNQTLTPIMFEYMLFEKARKDKKTIVLPEATDERVLRAAEILLRRDVVNIILLGKKEDIEHKSLSLGLDLSKAQIVEIDDYEHFDEFVEEFYKLRSHKGVTLESARDVMHNLSYFATMMVHLGYADGMVSGAIHTTAETIRPALQIIKTKPDISIVSSIFFMCLDTKVLVYGDCAVNQDPNAKELAQIAISSALSAKTFGIEPRVAMLSYSTGSSGSGKDVQKVVEATKIARELRADIPIEGPIQYDAAIDPEVAKKKLPNSKVAGRATVFIFPDLNTGNNTYKAVQRSTNAVAIGPILQGLKKPVNDLSRGCLVSDIVNTIVITALQAQSS